MVNDKEETIKLKPSEKRLIGIALEVYQFNLGDRLQMQGLSETGKRILKENHERAVKLSKKINEW